MWGDDDTVDTADDVASAPRGDDSESASGKSWSFHTATCIAQGYLNCANLFSVCRHGVSLLQPLTTAARTCAADAAKCNKSHNSEALNSVSAKDRLQSVQSYSIMIDCAIRVVVSS